MILVLVLDLGVDYVDWVCMAERISCVSVLEGKTEKGAVIIVTITSWSSATSCRIGLGPCRWLLKFVHYMAGIGNRGADVN